MWDDFNFSYNLPKTYRRKMRAFTLIELLVVIAIIALLLSIIIPSLNLAKRKAAAAICLSNAKNLSAAWYMYQEDNDGLIPQRSRSMEVMMIRASSAGW